MLVGSYIHYVVFMGLFIVMFHFSLRLVLGNQWPGLGGMRIVTWHLNKYVMRWIVFVGFTVSDVEASMCFMMYEIWNDGRLCLTAPM